ncbi:ANTAR domain-containing protein [Nonomuraea thailandensis]
MHDLQHPAAPDPGSAGSPELPDAGAATNVGRLAATIERLREAVREAQHAAEGRALIEVAKGILIERLGCGLTEAARQIATLAEQAGVSPIEMSADIINHAARDRISETAREFLNAARSHEAPAAAGRARPRAGPARPSAQAQEPAWPTALVPAQGPVRVWRCACAAPRTACCRPATRRPWPSRCCNTR